MPSLIKTEEKPERGKNPNQTTNKTPEQSSWKRIAESGVHKRSTQMKNKEKKFYNKKTVSSSKNHQGNYGM